MGFGARIEYHDIFDIEFDNDAYEAYNYLDYTNRVEYVMYVFVAEIFAICISICIGMLICLFLFGLFVAVGIVKKQPNLLPL